MEHTEELIAVNTELHEASIELNAAETRYHNAILARIALRTIINEESHGNV